MEVADRLSFISANTFGAFSSITTRGLPHPADGAGPPPDP